MTMRAAIYERVSTSGQIDKYGLDSQEHEIRGYIERRGWQIIGSYVDAGISGRKSRDGRPELDRLLRDVEADKIDVIVVYKLDRLSRKPLHMYQMLEVLDNHKVAIVTATDGVDTRTPAGKLALGIVIQMAEQFWLDFQERSRGGKLAKARQGKASKQGQRKYGYEFNPDTAQIEVVETEAETILRMFNWYASGISPLEIADRLNKEGVPTNGKAAHGWTGERVSHMFDDTEYIGQGYRNKEHGPVERKKNGGARYRPESEWIPIAYPRIIPAELWERVQAQRQSNKRKGCEARADKSLEYMLDGLLYCGECGYRFNKKSWAGKQKQRLASGEVREYANKSDRRYYSDSGMERYPQTYQCRSSKSLRAEAIDNAVWERVRAALKSPQYHITELKAAADNLVQQTGEQLEQYERADRELVSGAK